MNRFSMLVVGSALWVGLFAARTAWAVDPPSYVTAWGGTGSENNQFTIPFGVAVTPGSGTVYVADYGNDRVQKFDGNGLYLSTLGTPGSGDGQLRSPYGVAVDAAGNVYVADRGNHRIQKFSSTGSFLWKVGGTTAGSGNGQFNSPFRIAVAPDDKIYVADGKNHRIQVFTSAGTFLSKWDTPGLFMEPCGLAVSASAVYVSDLTDYVQKFDLSGTFLQKWGGSGGNDGQFRFPGGMAMSQDGILYVADLDNNRVQGFDANGAFLFKFGLGTPGNQAGQFNGPADVALGPAGGVFVADSNNDRIQRWVESIVAVVPSTWGGLKNRYARR